MQWLCLLVAMSMRGLRARAYDDRRAGVCVCRFFLSVVANWFSRRTDGGFLDLCWPLNLSSSGHALRSSWGFCGGYTRTMDTETWHSNAYDLCATTSAFFLLAFAIV